MFTFSNWLKYLAFVCVLQTITVFASQPKMVIYWGQDSAGDFTNVPSQQEQPLRHYCSDSSYDIIVVGFVYLFPFAPGDSVYPGMNFANHCEVPFSNSEPYLLNCTGNVAPDIEYCQSRGKTILISFGGGVGQYGFSSDSQGQSFATLVWNMFLGGNDANVIRPFGNAVFDGVDLDIEGGTTTGYTLFISTLRQYFATASKPYYISAAPQCFYPDRLGPGAGTPFSTAWFDYIWIQFYNNHCGLDEPNNFNYAIWSTWASTGSVNPNVKLFIGAPASSLAAASGFVSLATLESIATEVSTAYPSTYGGIMIWDASTSDLNGNFGASVASFVHSTSSVPASTSSSTSSTTSSSSSKSSSSSSTSSSSSSTSSSSSSTSSSSSSTSSTSEKGSTTSTSGSPVSLTSTSTSTSSSGSVSTSCISRDMRCASSETYQTCYNGVWEPVQSCQVGMTCHPAGSVIYCY